MSDPITDERLAEIRDRSAWLKESGALMGDDLAALLDEVDRLRNMSEQHRAQIGRLQDTVQAFQVGTDERRDGYDPCPHVVTGDDGTSWCRLAELDAHHRDLLLETIRDVADDLESRGLAGDRGLAQRLTDAADTAEETS